MKRNPRVFIGVTEIAGYYTNLTRGLRSRGISVTYFTMSTHPFQYTEDDYGWFPKLVKYCFAKREETSRDKSIRKLYWKALARLGLYSFLVWALLRHDVFIFSFGKTLLKSKRDLALYKFFRKRVIANLGHGSELRPPYTDGFFQSPDGTKDLTLEELRQTTAAMKSTAQCFEKYADVIVGAPYSSSPFLKQKFVNSLILGIPRPHAEPFPGGKESEVVRVLHAPSHPAAKGSKHIVDVVRSLQTKGHAVELEKLVGVPNREVLEKLSNCHFVIDQLYSDTPMAGFAAEAASFGKPAVVGGYGLEELRQHVPVDMFPPSQACHPDHLERAVEQLITDADYRQDLGRRAKKFVETNWSEKLVAGRYLRLINDDTPADWWVDPQQVTYLHGVGLSEDCCKAKVKGLVEAHGVAALQLSQRPSLERAFLEFSGLNAT